MINPQLWQDMPVFLTGHTGFKGAWLALWLEELGATIHGYALSPATSPSLYQLAPARLKQETLSDLADIKILQSAMMKAQPKVVFHLAAQSLVRRSFADPLESFATNVQGTANVLEAARHVDSVRAVIIITTDKVYEAGADESHAFEENDPLGGYDPYAASKACAELVTQSYRRSFLQERGVAVATARAGNVIGGGDWAKERIVPDIIAAANSKSALTLRYPKAVRPWQHVLEPLAGYLMFAERLLTEKTSPHALNFGPEPEHFKTVAELVDTFHTLYSPNAEWKALEGHTYHETQMLTLNSKLAQKTLGWKSKLDFSTTLRWTTDWYNAFYHNEDMAIFTRNQIADYMQLMLADTKSHKGKKHA